VSSRRVVVAAYASFVLIGWSSLLAPSLIRDIKGEFGQTDAGFGLLYFVASFFFAAGAFLSGALAGRIGRRTILAAAALALATGLAAEGLAPTWPILLAGVAFAGFGGGTIDAGVNSVVMDLSASGRGSALNRLHLFYSVGALGAPIVMGMLLDAGLAWRLPMLVSAVAALLLVAPLRSVGAVPARPRAVAADLVAGRSGPDFRLPLAALGIAITCYVATELGVSNWAVEFLSDEPISVATLALGLFWLGHAGGRLIAIRVADRFPPVAFTVACVFFAAGALIAAVVGPGGGLRLALFAAVGLGLGPVYPMIMAVAGSLYPHRAAAVSGLLTSAGVAGAVVYPPLMGLASETVGLGAGMLGAAVLAMASGIAVIAAGRRAAGRAPEPVPVPPGIQGS
jgi:fucose permease